LQQISRRRRGTEKSDQQSIVYVSPTDLEQPAFNNEISKGNLQHLFNLQLDQQSKEVLLCEFDDPFADYLESMSSIDVKIVSVRRRLSLSFVQTSFLHDISSIIVRVKIKHFNSKSVYDMAALEIHDLT
jgi:hypothetical protein